MPRILVIDDEHAVRTIIELVLKRDGHQVEQAASGQAGIDMTCATVFDAAFVDMNMPGLDGAATIAGLRALTPGVPVVVMSGMLAPRQGETDAPALPDGGARIAWLQKPFRPNDVRQALAGALAGNTGNAKLTG